MRDAPLAERLRPASLAEVVGQQHLLAEGKVFRRTIEGGLVPNMIFYGPSGCGKTTVARIIAQNSGMKLHKLNGTSASTGDIRDVMKDIGTFGSQNGILLYLDEIQYLNKKQQQSLLEYIEDGSITLIASTTENPYFYIYHALLSRCTVFEFKPLTPEDAEQGLQNAVEKIEALDGISIETQPGALRKL
ncbi:MAG: AAA family ATPase, partial [Oscillospiraceae bacterium]